jgi:hypothetical protein
LSALESHIGLRDIGKQGNTKDFVQAELEAGRSLRRKKRK